MSKAPGEEAPTPQSIAAYVKTNAARAKKAQTMNHGVSAVIRETDYKGHHIVVRTTYEVEIDGKPMMGHIGVNNDGLVHYHPIPNLRFDSALDMVKKVIDVFPDDFGPNATSPMMPGTSHPAHGMPGMAMKRNPAAKKATKSTPKGKR